MTEGSRVLENIANIRVPVIAAIEGRAHIHSDYALLSQCDCGGRGSDSASRTWGITRLASCRATESLPRGVIALEQDEPKRSFSTHSRCRRARPMNGEWSRK